MVYFARRLRLGCKSETAVIQEKQKRLSEREAKKEEDTALCFFLHCYCMFFLFSFFPYVFSKVYYFCFVFIGEQNAYGEDKEPPKPAVDTTVLIQASQVLCYRAAQEVCSNQGILGAPYEQKDLDFCQIHSLSHTFFLYILL